MLETVVLLNIFVEVFFDELKVQNNQNLNDPKHLNSSF